MDFLKKNKVLVAIVLTVLILVLIRSLGTDHFKSDAKKWAEPSVLHSNIITPEAAGSLSGTKLIIDLEKEKSGTNLSSGNEIEILPDAILQSENLKKIKKNNGPVLLYSSDPSVSSRIWMILSQLGYKNLFILTKDADNEVLKYKLPIDSTNSK
jgi:hypothetical protein